MKKLIFMLTTMSLLLSLCGCTNENDHIAIYNRSDYIFDDINIPIIEGFFYDRHEKFAVDNNTVGVTVYFSRIDEGGWELKGAEE